MKNYTKIVLILTFALCYSCNQEQKQIDASYTKIPELRSDNLNSDSSLFDAPKKSDLDKIVGNYYVNNFYTYLKSGFTIKLKKPKDKYVQYTFEFKENGEIVFKDLTKSYGCGNGVLSIKKGTWKAKENDLYELTFDGSRAFQSKFHTESEYRLVELKNGDKKLKLTKVILNQQKLAWQ
jgi:uncharacterized protein YegP (UPF0339 family)